MLGSPLISLPPVMLTSVLWGAETYSILIPPIFLALKAQASVLHSLSQGSLLSAPVEANRMIYLSMELLQRY